MGKRELDRLLSELILLCDDMEHYHKINGDYLSALKFLYQSTAYIEVREYLRGNRDALRKNCCSLRRLVEEQKAIAERKEEEE